MLATRLTVATLELVHGTWVASLAYGTGALVAGIALLGVGGLALIVLRSHFQSLHRIAAEVDRLDEPGSVPCRIPRNGELRALAAALGRLSTRINQHRARLIEEMHAHQRTAERLQRQLDRERTYLAVIESCEDAVITSEVSGAVTAWNGAAAQLYGYSAQEASGMLADRLVPSDREAEEKDLLRRVIAGECVKHFETVRVSKQGQRIDVLLSMSPLFSPDGAIVGIARLTHDITERKEAEDRFRIVVDACPSGVCAVDEGGAIILVNQAVERLFGYAREELIGSSIEKLVPTRFRGVHAGHRSQYAADAKARPMGAGRDLFARRKDGREIAVEIGLCPVTIHGKRAFLASIVDVTERRRAQAELGRHAAKLERTNAELEKFAYVVSHDIKAPLRGIASVAQWLAEDFGPIVDHDSRENLELMLERTGRLDRLIDGILEYSRAGRMGVALISVDTRALLGDVISSIAPPESRRVRLEGEFPIVEYDETQLRQVFQNLIDNAVEHLGKPEGDIVVSAADRGQLWEFSVSDNGIGIPERHFTRIFELFQTLRPKDECKTTGAGLAIVKRIVESNGGEIVVASTEGTGTTFKFTVQKVRREESQTALEASTA